MSCCLRWLWISATGVLEFWSHGVMEKIISGRRRMVKMSGTQFPDFEFS
ncbi:hypothetical protein D1BOALGB6SA_8894 [Olavius sp. associated proteobacterium Delta 1]|nr:hypothetical protein D1BOALGB6SA_8894 [Olavius sp. associated proteobacterium Delta 1]